MILLLIILAGGIVAVGLICLGCATLTRRRTGHSSVGRTSHGLATLAGAAAAAVYVWGALHVVGPLMEAEGGGADSSPAPACVRAGGVDQAAHVDGYRIEYLPIRLVCHLDKGGGSFTADSAPGYVAPAVLGLGLTAVALPILTAFAAEYRSRRKAPARV
ncbi:MULTISPECIES: hypothetical protein [Kitasatospora]|uniref:Integral membrane protein n=1 Tax=Kitasatospora cystarginea TaxID=58350 RepID=A0ABP5RJG6_9ACTN